MITISQVNLWRNRHWRWRRGERGTSISDGGRWLAAKRGEAGTAAHFSAGQQHKQRLPRPAWRSHSVRRLPFIRSPLFRARGCAMSYLLQRSTREYRYRSRSWAASAMLVSVRKVRCPIFMSIGSCETYVLWLLKICPSGGGEDWSQYLRN